MPTDGAPDLIGAMEWQWWDPGSGGIQGFRRKTDVGAMKPEPDVDSPIRYVPEVTSGPASQGANGPVSFLRQEGCAGETSLTATGTVPKPRRRKSASTPKPRSRNLIGATRMRGATRLGTL